MSDVNVFDERPNFQELFPILTWMIPDSLELYKCAVVQIAAQSEAIWQHFWW